MHWKPGAHIVQYEMWGQGIGTARPVTVVDDAPARIVLYSHPGVTLITRGTENRRSLDLQERIDLMVRMLDPNVGEFKEAISPDSHVLTITPHGSWHSVMLFWSVEWDFRTWYVNFQSPLRRVSHGVQIHDYALDIVVRPDMSWTWKDVEEFEGLIARGVLTPSQESSIRTEAAQLVRIIESGGPPFCDGWENWRPAQRWAIPQLPSNWSDTNWIEPGAR